MDSKHNNINSKIAETFSSFKTNNFHVPKSVNRDELPNGRPLWQRDICKVVPAPDIYNINRDMGKKANPNQDCTFGNGYEAYQKTCDINNMINRNQIRIYDFVANNEINKCPTTQTKKTVPKFSFTKGKQNTLWNAERKRAYVTPGPSSYNAVNDRIQQQTRYQGNRAMGFDIKCNQKDIRIAPGPADYQSEVKSTFVKASHNYCYNTGNGLKRPDTITPKEELIIKYFGAKPPKTSAQKKKSSNQSFINMYQQKDQKQVPVGGNLLLNQQRVSSQQLKRRLYSPVNVSSTYNNPHIQQQPFQVPGNMTGMSKPVTKYNTLVSQTPMSDAGARGRNNNSLSNLKLDGTMNLTQNIIGEYNQQPVTTSQQYQHINPTQLLLKGNKGPGRKTFTAVGQRKRSAIRASKKSVTAMSASKASQAASTTNHGYDSENFGATSHNFNRVANKELFSGGYQTQDNASGYHSGDIMGGELLDGFDSSVKMGQPPRWVQGHQMNKTMDYPGGMRVFKDKRGMPSVALRMSHQPVSIDKSYDNKKFIRARSVNRFELRETRSGDFNQLDHTNFI